MMFTPRLLFCLLLRPAAAVVQPGGVCWSYTGGVSIGGCSSGTQCGPWLPEEGYSPTTTSSWHCLAYPRLQSGAACDYNNKIGPCATGLNCCNGVCGVCTTPPPTAGCSLEGRAVCGDTLYPSFFTNHCCRSPYTCALVTGSGRTSVCQGSDLPAGSSCWSDTTSSATCASGTTCQRLSGSTTGICTASAAASSCSGPQTGVPGQNICYNGELGHSYGACCPDANTGSTSVQCLPDLSLSGGSIDRQDRFCMQYNIPEGGSCGTTAAQNYAGLCATGLNCDRGVCSTGPALPNSDCSVPSPCWNEGQPVPTSCCASEECNIITSYTGTSYCPVQ